MEQHLTLFAWFTGILVLTILAADILLVFKFRRYFRANGFGIVTLTLLSFVMAHLIGACLYGITTLVVIVTNGQSDQLFYPMNEVASYWIITSSLFHIAGITLQRLFSFSFGKRFLIFSHSKVNIWSFILIIWLLVFVTTLLCTISQKPTTNAVFFIGFFFTGILTVFNFLITIESTFFKVKILQDYNNKVKILEDYNATRHEQTEEYKALTPSTSRKVRVVQNPRKTFSLFSGLVFSFILFCLPSAIPHLIFSLRDKLLISSTSLVISLWLLLGVVFNSVWILIRLRSTINDTSGFYARWTLHKSRENIALFLRKAKKQKDLRLLNDEDDDFIGNSDFHDTSHESIS